MLVKLTPGVLNEDPTIWLDGAKLAKTCTPLPSWGKYPLSCIAYSPQKNVCKYKKLSKFYEISFLLIKK
jgi:hypothetical protein